MLLDHTIGQPSGLLPPFGMLDYNGTNCVLDQIILKLTFAHMSVCGVCWFLRKLLCLLFSGDQCLSGMPYVDWCKIDKRGLSQLIIR